MNQDKNSVLIYTDNCQPERSGDLRSSLSIIHCQFRKWIAFPEQTQYHYAYNSPLTYRDPSGLAPEKVKEREELMVLVIDWDKIYADIDAIYYENDRRTNQGMTNADGSTMVNEIEESGGYGSTRYKGNRTGCSSSAANGQGGVVSSGNSQDDNNDSPTYAGTLFVETPKDFSEESWDETLKKSGVYEVLNALQKDNPEKEVGYFIRKDGDNYFADYFIGIDKDTWMDVSKNPYGRKLNSNEMIIGFVHIHPDHTDMFSMGDRRAIKETSLGKIGWMNRPYISRNYDPISLDMQFYAVCYGGLYNISRFRDILSSNSASSSLMMQQFRNEIIFIGSGSFHLNHYKVSEFLKRK